MIGRVLQNTESCVQYIPLHVVARSSGGPKARAARAWVELGGGRALPNPERRPRFESHESSKSAHHAQEVLGTSSLTLCHTESCTKQFNREIRGSAVLSLDPSRGHRISNGGIAYSEVLSRAPPRWCLILHLADSVPAMDEGPRRSGDLSWQSSPVSHSVCTSSRLPILSSTRATRTLFSPKSHEGHATSQEVVGGRAYV